ncbi:MAG: DciA family protein [Fidelibacterota bacterium]
MQTLKQVLNIYLHKTGLAKGIAQNTAITIWPEIVGKAVSENTQAESVEHGVLTIITTTPAWRQELQFQKSDIVSKINERIGKNTIKDIKFL